MKWLPAAAFLHFCLSVTSYPPYLPVVIFLLPSLHTHLPRPQRLCQTPCQTRRSATTIRLVWCVPPTFAIARTHAHGAVSRRRRRCWFLAASGSFRRRWRGGFRFCGRGAGGGAVNAVGGRRGRRCGSDASDGLRWSWRWDGLGGVFCEVGGGNPALSGPVELFCEPPAWSFY